eukprot:gene7184-biopygen16522
MFRQAKKPARNHPKVTQRGVDGESAVQRANASLFVHGARALASRRNSLRQASPHFWPAARDPRQSGGRRRLRRGAGQGAPPRPRRSRTGTTSPPLRGARQDCETHARARLTVLPGKQLPRGRHARTQSQLAGRTQCDRSVRPSAAGSCKYTRIPRSPPPNPCSNPRPRCFVEMWSAAGANLYSHVRSASIPGAGGRGCAPRKARVDEEAERPRGGGLPGVGEPPLRVRVHLAPAGGAPRPLAHPPGVTGHWRGRGAGMARACPVTPGPRPRRAPETAAARGGGGVAVPPVPADRAARRGGAVVWEERQRTRTGRGPDWPHDDMQRNGRGTGRGQCRFSLGLPGPVLVDWGLAEIHDPQVLQCGQVPCIDLSQGCAHFTNCGMGWGVTLEMGCPYRLLLGYYFCWAWRRVPLQTTTFFGARNPRVTPTAG